MMWYLILASWRQISTFVQQMWTITLFWFDWFQLIISAARRKRRYLESRPEPEPEMVVFWVPQTFKKNPRCFILQLHLTKASQFCELVELSSYLFPSSYLPPFFSTSCYSPAGVPPLADMQIELSVVYNACLYSIALSQASEAELLLTQTTERGRFMLWNDNKTRD